MNNKTSKRTIGSVGEICSKNSFLSTLFALLVMILIQAAVQGFNAGSFTGMFGKMWIAWLNILRNNAYAGVIALGMCFAIITRRHRSFGRLHPLRHRRGAALYAR